MSRTSAGSSRGLAVYHAAFVAEALRSGINYRSEGSGRGRSGPLVWISAKPCPMWCCPQAFRGAIAPLGNVMIALTKNTTVVATIGVAEASYLMKASMIEFRPDLIYAIFGIMAAGFVILTLPMGMLFTTLSRRLAVKPMSAEASVLVRCSRAQGAYPLPHHCDHRQPRHSCSALPAGAGARRQGPVHGRQMESIHRPGDLDLLPAARPAGPPWSRLFLDHPRP